MSPRKPAAPRSMDAIDVRPGDVLHIATGRVKILEAYLSHGGCEWVVRAHPSKRSDGGGRVLWAWPSQMVPCDPSERIMPPDCPGPRPAKPLAGAAARKAAP